MFCAAQVAFAEELVERFLRGSAQKLASLSQSGGSNRQAPDKETVRVLLHCIQKGLNGIRTCLPDLMGPGGQVEGENLAIRARVSRCPRSSDSPWHVA